MRDAGKMDDRFKILCGLACRPGLGGDHLGKVHNEMLPLKTESG